MKKIIWIIPMLLLVFAIPFAAAKSDSAAWEKAIDKVAAKLGALLANDDAQDAKIATLEARVEALEDSVGALYVSEGLPPPPFYDGEGTGDSPSTDPGGSTS